MTRDEFLTKYRNVLEYLKVVSEAYMNRDDIYRFVQQIIKDVEEMKGE